MARLHGKDARAYLGKRDVSGDLTTITPDVMAETHDVTVFSGDGWRASDPGLKGYTAELEGFYDEAVGGVGRQLEDLLGADGGILSVYFGAADGVGDRGSLYPDAILTKRGQPMTVSDIVKLTGTLQGKGRVGLDGRLLHPKGTETATNNGTSLDNTLSSVNGGRATLHVTAAVNDGGTVKIQHSPDNAVWADLVTFTAATAADVQTVEVSGTVDRYLRQTFTRGAAVGSTLTYVVGFARY